MVRLQEGSKVARLEMEQTLYAGTIKVGICRKVLKFYCVRRRRLIRRNLVKTL